MMRFNFSLFIDFLPKIILNYFNYFETKTVEENG